MRWWAAVSDEKILVLFRIEDIDYVQEFENGILVFMKNGKHVITETYTVESFASLVLGDHSSEAINLVRDT